MTSHASTDVCRFDLLSHPCPGELAACEGVEDGFFRGLGEAEFGESLTN